MEPISLILGGVGLATSLFGGIMQSSIANKEAGISQDIVAAEEAENKVRQQAMMLSGQRKDIEILRTAQRARSAAVQAGATQTGSLTGSGVKGGVQNTEAEGAWGTLGVNNQLQLGNRMFNLDAIISGYKEQMASLGGQFATDQGISSLGGGIMNIAGKVGSMFGFGNPNNGAAQSQSNPYNQTGSLY